MVSLADFFMLTAEPIRGLFVPFNHNRRRGINTLNTNELLTYGWNERWAEAAGTMSLARQETLVPARVTLQYSNQYRIVTEAGERMAVVSGRLQYTASSRSDYPAVGDWVLIESRQGEPHSPAVIHAVLPRMSSMTRKEAGGMVDEQVIAANVDTIFIVAALNQDYNLRRLERYLIAVWESGARPVILLTKADLCEDPAGFLAQVEAIAPGVPCHAVSALQDQGRAALAPYLLTGCTIAVTGSSGAGKSTLLNWLAGEDLQRVQMIREEDARGRHTTTHRQLFPLPDGALFLDTPGMRELQLWDSESGWSEAFADIMELASQCRFQDCSHDKETGCAVKLALQEGVLDAGRIANYRKTQKELARMERKHAGSVRKMKQLEKRRTAKSGAGKNDWRKSELQD
jgi:ribosome biogenesis GTPase / thiamine phosphate phosphatase